MSQCEGNVIQIRDAVSEICEPFPELLTKQHALRVESDALVIGHALPDATVRNFRTVAREGAWRLESLGAKHQTRLTRKRKTEGT